MPARRTAPVPALPRLDCAARHFLISVCLTEEDLDVLGYWHAEERAGLSPQAWCRGYLATLCARDGEPARRVADHLDLRFAETVLALSSLCTDRVLCVCQNAARGQYGGDLCGLLWAILTDEREEVLHAGHRLMNELCVRALRDIAS